MCQSSNDDSSFGYLSKLVLLTFFAFFPTANHPADAEILIRPTPTVQIIPSPTRTTVVVVPEPVDLPFLPYIVVTCGLALIVILLCNWCTMDHQPTRGRAQSRPAAGHCFSRGQMTCPPPPPSPSPIAQGLRSALLWIWSILLRMLLL